MRALHRVVELHPGLADGAQDVGHLQLLGLLGAGFRLELGRDLAEVDRGRSAVQADVSRLSDAVVQEVAAGIDLDLGEQGAKKLASALLRSHEQHG